MKKRVYFFLLFEFPRESSRDHRGDFPGDLDPGVRAKGEHRLPPKPQVDVVRMRPRELSLRVPTWTSLHVRLHI